METPIYDFAENYAKSNLSRLHMPGHKGHGPLGVEALDITEIMGADSLYEADGIIEESERNATAIFGTGRTFYSTEGSTHGIRAMLFLALTHWKRKYWKQVREGVRPAVVAARNAHKAFLTAAVLLDLDIVWLWGEGARKGTLCACPVSEKELSDALGALAYPPVAVYVTSPDYLGGMLDLSALAAVAHAHGTWFLVDNAHGAYLHFLPKPLHPMDLGADICCDSAHKTLPVLTGGAYLHIAQNMFQEMGGEAEKNVRQALALFGSTSPSYLILESLDLANRYLAEDYKERLTAFINSLEQVKNKMRSFGWKLEETEPLKLTVAAKRGCSGNMLSWLFRAWGVECEYADKDFLVLMVTPENTQEDFKRILCCIEGITQSPTLREPEKYLEKEPSMPVYLPPRRVCSVREAVFAPHETIPVQKAAGRVMGPVAVHCPPAIPVVVSGEEIREDIIPVLEYYRIQQVEVMCTDAAPV